MKSNFALSVHSYKSSVNKMFRVSFVFKSPHNSVNVLTMMDLFSIHIPSP
jgi:hypothetical protein